MADRLILFATWIVSSLGLSKLLTKLLKIESNLWAAMLKSNPNLSDHIKFHFKCKYESLTLNKFWINLPIQTAAILDIVDSGLR